MFRIKSRKPKLLGGALNITEKIKVPFAKNKVEKPLEKKMIGMTTECCDVLLPIITSAHQRTPF